MRTSRSFGQNCLVWTVFGLLSLSATAQGNQPPAGGGTTLRLINAGPDENQFQEFIFGPTFLVNGRNVVAVEVHQVNVTSTDLGFDLELTATLSADEPLPVVAIEATVPETVEPSPNSRVRPGEFTITRAGNTNEPLILFVEFDGTATFGEDYEPVLQYLFMPPGETSLKVLVGPQDDSVVEGDETVVATLSPNPPINSLPNYRIDPQRNQATVVIHDNDPVTTRLDIISPRNGQQFQPGDTIELRAQVIGPGSGELWSVDFFDGDQRIGTTRAYAPIWWGDASGDPHVISARATNAQGMVLASVPPATIQVGPGAALPVVRIGATPWQTGEPCPTCFVVPSVLTIERTAPTNAALTVFLAIDGTATAGDDYQSLPASVEIPAGQRSAQLTLLARDDQLAEGPEVVRVRVLPQPPPLQPPTYLVNLYAKEALVVIFDDEPEAPQARLDIVAPTNGSHWEFPSTVQLSALAVYTQNEVYGPVEFYAGDQLVARSLVTATTGPPIPGLPSVHTAYWTNPPVGQHVLTARTRLSFSRSITSPPVNVTVDSPMLPVVSLELVDGEAAETLVFQNAIFWAEFRVLRTGDPTNELVVSINTRQGSARLGEDYWLAGVRGGSAVRFPAGARSVTFRLYPIDDDIYEGDETVFFHLIAPPPTGDPYEIEFAHSSVAMVIHDNDPVTTRLDITRPRNGQHFEAGDVIELRAQIIGPGGSDSWSVEFFDGDQPVGTVQPGGAIWWQGASGGPHIINARAVDPNGVLLMARPVTISVGPGPALPVVSIIAQGRGQTLEPCPVCLVPAAAFTVSRTGPTSAALNVSLEYDGSATPGQDYQVLPHQVTIPAGTNSAHLLMLALDDRLVEGPEIVRARLVSPQLATGGYVISSYASEAMVVIYDDERGAPEIRLDIAEPEEGAQFTAGTTIEVSALGVWTRGEVDRPVEFFAGDRFIGQSNPPQYGRPTIPGLPSVHTIYWTNPPAGRYVLTARFAPGPSLAVTSPPVQITVVGEPPRAVVRIEATARIAEEDSTPFDRLNLVGVFTVSRTGPTNDPLPVYVQYSGSATAGEDYPALPWRVTIPAGVDSTEIRVVPIPDSVPEGIETLVATISNCPPPGSRPPCYDFDIEPARATATVFLRDDGVTDASLVITSPKDGVTFKVGDTILVEAIAIDLHGYISQVGLWDRSVEQQIGFSEIVFIRPPDPGTPIRHTFAWSDAAPGPHVLEARVIGAGGTFEVLRSQPVRITVEPLNPQAPRVAIIQPVTDTEFPPDTAIEIVAETRDPDGYVRRMEFFADGRKIGEASVEFIRPPDPGQPQTFTFVWREPTPGPHALTARATDDDGDMAVSAPVEIRVATSEPLPIVTVTAPDPVAVEPRSQTDLNTATFRVRRFGPTNDALVVAYSLHGTAGNGTDYELLPGLATIPAGRRSVTVIVRPLADDWREGIETVLLRLEQPPPPSPEIRVINPYRVGRPRLAVAVISDGPWSPAPRAAQCLALPGNLLHLCFAVETGRNFRLEASTDFRNWQTLFDTVGLDGTWHFIDADMEDHPRRFYRLTPEPVAEVDE